MLERETMSDQNRLVLAYSGGLDTSVAISYLKERTGKDVVAVSLDVGQGGESLETIKQRALACGAVEAYVVDARDEFANEYCMKALKANAMYEGVYPLVSAISRPLISKHLVRAAHQFGADTISHGCTGKGNDQVRFEVSIASIDPTLKAISPIRDLSLTRDVDRADREEPVLHRPERVGPRHRDRFPRGSVERSDQGLLLLHRRSGVPTGRG